MCCGHEEGVQILPITVDQAEQLGVTCRQCQIIWLYSPKTDKMVAAFSHPQYVPGHMCQGDSGVLYVVGAKEKSNSIVQLNCTTLPFTGPSKVISSDMADLFFMYYVPPPHKLIVITDATDSSHIKAISVETDSLTWEIKGKIDGEMCHPRGMLFSPQHDALLVADGKRCRVLVLHPQGWFTSEDNTAWVGDGCDCSPQLVPLSDSCTSCHCR